MAQRITARQLAQNTAKRIAKRETALEQKIQKLKEQFEASKATALQEEQLVADTKFARALLKEAGVDESGEFLTAETSVFLRYIAGDERYGLDGSGKFLPWFTPQAALYCADPATTWAFEVYCMSYVESAEKEVSMKLVADKMEATLKANNLDYMRTGNHMLVQL
jgi:hypothetical protein